MGTFGFCFYTRLSLKQLQSGSFVASFLLSTVHSITYEENQKSLPNLDAALFDVVFLDFWDSLL